MYKTTIGLEAHVQLSTKTKLFCGCKTQFGQAPNSQVCPICLGLPGSLPVLNEKAFELALKTALALNCNIEKLIKFERKNYFYPDLPKAYQISQYSLPLSSNGFLKIEAEGGSRKIGITRAHLEEDAGKLIHGEDTQNPEDREASFIDYNRVGIPLMEIVSQPELNSPEEAYQYLVSLKRILRYLEVSDCNMEEGSLRCDANISLRRKGDTKLGTKVELKNMNSFRGIKAALEFEAKRQ
ncbi:MAG: Asp-tRNA(Asn)/Glu-tRNA(Gln) amidotransferase subunit GatB, partial [Desulfobacteraceae bacterium]|nr:Asp-tRNA(Asn)/Glu-tRNA(Gln) amidotransferase subunit GatB [Desulfobacteraceae bacterium]